MSASALRSRTLGVLQAAVAGLFLISGVSKFTLPVEILVGTTTLPVAFFQFIGVCEFLGALGLVLPGALRTRRDLTPIAAGALVIVMSGAVGMALQGYGVSAAILPGATGIACAIIAYGRRAWLDEATRRRGVPDSTRATVQPSHL